MKNNSGNNLKYYLELSKIKIMIPVSLTGFTGYFIFNPHITFSLFIVSAGILLMAISASVLNQIQEASLDLKMNRTHNRPIPAMNISKLRAVLFFVTSLIAGMALIYAGGNLRAVIIGLITLVWYNCIYTCSKRISAFSRPSTKPRPRASRPFEPSGTGTLPYIYH